MKKIIFIVLFSPVLFLACESSQIIKNNGEQTYVDVSLPVSDFSRGKLVSSYDYGSMTKEQMEELMEESGAPSEFEVDFGVQLVKITYVTIDHAGNKVLASGMLNIALSDQELPILSNQHGTLENKSLAPSEGGGIGILSAVKGYLTLEPDYLGYGENEEDLHPYLHAKTLATATIDMLRSSKEYFNEHDIPFSKKLFFMGYSEGGHATLATVQEIEKFHSGEFNITAASVGAGPYDMVATAQYYANSQNIDSTVFIPMVLVAYHQIYHFENPLSDWFNSTFLDDVEDYQMGRMEADQLQSQLPNDPSDILTPNFLASIQNLSNAEFLNALDDNSLIYWTPQTPLSFFHGVYDTVVPFENSQVAFENFQANGASHVELVECLVGDANHGDCGYPHFEDAMEWFEQF